MASHNLTAKMLRVLVSRPTSASAVRRFATSAGSRVKILGSDEAYTQIIAVGV